MASLSDLHFVLIDTETTGRDAAACDLLEVAAIHVDAKGRSFARFEALVNPGRPIPHDSMGIHHITDEDVADAPPRFVVEAALQRFVPPDAICVAHNAAYDSVVLLDPLGDRRWLCTERLAHHLDHDAPNFKLQTLRYRYGHRVIDTRGLDAHRAIADVLVLARVFETLFSLYLALRKYDLAGDVGQQLVAFAAAPYEVKTMLFGKHAGTPIAELPSDYLRWGAGPRGFTDNPDMLHTFTRELSRRDALAGAA